MQLIVDIRAEAWLAKLKGGGERLSQNMVRVVTRLSLLVQGAVKDKLTGQVLHVRTGTLRRSINRVVEKVGDGAIATIGTNVSYAGVHEFGFDGDVSVKAHVRKIAHPGKKSPGVANVRAYTRHMHVPERSYLRSTLREWTPRIRQELKAAAMESVT